MSRLRALIAKLCPDGVEFRPLGDLLAYEQPGPYLVDSADYDESVGTPVLTAGKTFVLGYTSETEGIYRASADLPVVIFDDFTTAFKWVDFPFKAKSSAMKMLKARPNGAVSLAYAYLAMQTINYSPQDHARQWISRYSKFRIPVPPAEVQVEIVRILNSFSLLEANLNEELNKRRQQYFYYTDSLLDRGMGEEVRWIPLGELGTFTRGRRFVNGDFVEDGIPCIHYGELYTHYGLFASETKSHVRPDLLPSLRLGQPGDLIVVGGGENVEDVCKAVAWLGETPVAVHDECYIFHHSLEPRYASYVFASGAFNREKAIYARGAKIVRVSIEDLAKIAVPVSPMSQQKRIVAALDKFDALVNNTASGLPAEISARRKQYEYYRDKLLTFEEAVA